VASLNKLIADLLSQDDVLAEAASSTLAQSGESSISKLKLLLESSEVEQRWWAIRTLAQMEAPPLLLLIESLADPVAEVREAAALALVTHPTEAALPALIRALGDGDTMVGTLAASALVSIGKPAVTILLETFPNSPQGVRIHIMHVLAEIRDHRAIPLMLKATETDSAILNYWAREGLERLGLDMIYIKPE
jgi:HEAT repeat protein